MREIKTPSDLKAAVNAAGHEPHFFDKETMRFFSDSMANYGVRRVQITAEYDAEGNYVAEGITREAFELYRRRPVKCGLKDSAHFDAETFSRVFPKREG